MSNIGPAASVLAMPVAGVRPDGEISSPPDANSSQSPAADASGADSFSLSTPYGPAPTPPPSSSPDPDELRQPYTRVRIDWITPGRPADRAGIRDGDDILSINGHLVSTREELGALIKQHPGGFTARILRGHEELDIHLVPEFQASTGRSLIGIYPVDIVTTYPDGMPSRYMSSVREMRDIDGSVLCTRSMKLSPSLLPLGGEDTRSRSVYSYILLYDEGGRTKEYDLIKRFNTTGASIYSWSGQRAESQSPDGWFSSGRVFILPPHEEPTAYEIKVFLHELAHTEQWHDPLFDPLWMHYGTCQAIEELLMEAKSTLAQWQETDRTTLVDGLRKSYAQILEKIYSLAQKLPGEYSPDEIFRLRIRMEGFFVQAGMADADIRDVEKALWALNGEVKSLLRPMHMIEWHADMVALRNLRAIREETGINLFAPHITDYFSTLANRMLEIVLSGQAPGIDSILADPFKYGIDSFHPEMEGFHPLVMKRIKEGFDRGISNGRISVPFTVIDLVQVHLAILGMKGPLAGAEKYLQGLRIGIG